MRMVSLPRHRAFVCHLSILKALELKRHGGKVTGFVQLALGFVAEIKTNTVIRRLQGNQICSNCDLFDQVFG